MTTPVAPTAPVPSAERRILFVHAHPDDETVSTGATMARYAAEGAHVTLVTCTLGEEGLVYVPELAGLAAAEGDQLGGYRLVELERACEALGVRDHRILGGAGRYRDSGMMGLDTNQNPRSFWSADLEAAAVLLLEVYREIRPQVVVTYDTNGGYGHPDHIQAHRVAMRGAELAAAEGFGPRRIYWSAIPRSVMAAGIEAFANSGNNPFEGVTSVDDIPFVVPDEKIAARIDGVAHVAAKQAAVAAHATQIPADSWLHTLATSFGGEALGHEYFTLAPGWEGGATEPVEDFFTGVETSPAPAPTP